MSEHMRTEIRGLRLLIGAMAAGVVILGVALHLWEGFPELDDRAQPILLLVVFLLPVCEIPAYLALRAGILRQAKELVSTQGSDEESRLIVLGHLRGLALLGAAFVGGAALLGVIVYSLTREAIVLAVPVVGVVLLLSMLPTEDKLERKVESVLHGDESGLRLD